MKKNKLIAVAALLFHVMTFSVPQGLAADGWVVMDNDGNVISQNDGNTTNVNVVDGSSYTVVNGDIALDQIINVNVLNSLGIADAGAKAVFNFNDGQASVWEGVLNLVGTAAFINAMGFDVAASFEGNVSGGAILSSLGINEAQFFAGVAELARGVNDPAAVINNGTWNVDPQSFLALVGSAVHNLGQINANGGAAVLAAGDKVTLDLTGGNGLISVAVDQAINAPVYDKNGNKISDVISNSGVIRANGGLAVLSAKAAESLFDNIVNHSGIIEANSLSLVNGRIILDGGDQGVTNVTGVLNAQGDNLGEKGGTVQVLGKKVGLFNNALVNVSGFAGGGTALIGGDYQGLGSVRNADATYIGQGVTIKADAIDEGDGGKIIAWSDNSTRVYGNLSAKGGSVSGNGGLIETSGKEYLDVEGVSVNASASNGNAGTWLLDPRNVEIRNQASSTGSFNGGSPNIWTPTATGGGSTPSIVDRNTIQTTLNNGTDVTINTTATIGSQSGDITVFDSIVTAVAGDGIATLTLNALGAISIGASITATSGILNLVLNAATTITQTAGSITANSVTFSAGGAVSLAVAANVWNLITGSTTAGAINIADSATNTTIQNLQTVGNAITYNHTGAGDVTVTGNVTSGNGVTNGGNITVNASNNLTIANTATVSSASGSGGTLTAGGATINGTVTAGAGNITFSGTALDTIINSPVVSAVNYVLSAIRDVIIQSSITTSAGSSVNITADSDLNGNGGVWIKQVGSIDSASDVTLTGSAINDAGAAGESIRIDADGSNNQILAAGNVTLQKSAAAPSTADIVVNGIVNATGNITINSADQIMTSNNGVAELRGNGLSLTAVNGIDVETQVNTVSINNSTSGNIGVEDMAGGLTVTGYTNGGAGTLNILTHSPLTIAANIIQAATINLTAGEAAGAGDNLTINAGVTVQATGAGSDVILNAGDNVVSNGTVQANDEVNITAGAGDTDNAGDLTLAGNVTAGTNASLIALKGDINQTAGAMTVPGTLTVTTNTSRDVSLEQAGNDFGTVTTGAGAVSSLDIRDANALILGNIGANSTSTITTNGNITDSGNFIGGANLYLDAGATNDITLDNANDFGGVGIISGRNVTLNDVNTVGFFDSTVSGTLNVTANGDIYDNPGEIIAVSGLTTLAAGAANDITLNNANNFSSVKVTSGKDVTLNDTGAINLDNSTISGLLSVTAGGLIDFIGNGATTVATTLGLTTTTGGINDSGSGSLAVTGTTTINATGAGNNVTLDNANNNFSTVAITNGNNVSLRDSGALDLGTSTIAGTLGVVTSGAITDSGAIVVNGGTTLTPGAANDITLDANNDFQGPVSIVSGKDVSINTNVLDLGNSTVTGILDVATVGALSDSGTVTAASLKFNAGTTATLDSANNDFDTIAGTSNGAIKINDVDSFSVGTVNGTDGIVSTNNNIELISGANITLDKAVNAGTGDATLTATGFIREGAVSDDGAPVADVIGKNIFLNSQVAAPSDALGLSTGYLDLQVSDTATGSWNVSVPNSGNVYINCIGDCPIGQVNVGTATFNFSTSGALLDANDNVNGEFNGGTWNITAGGLNVRTGSGFGTSTDAIELRLAGFAGVLTDAGRLAIQGGTGGVYATNLNLLNAAGLAIGGIAGSFVNGIAAQAGVGIGSGSPLAVNADVNDTGGGDIFLAALGNATTDDLTLNANVSASGGNGAVALVAGDTVIMNAGTTVTTAGTGEIDVLGGEDGTDFLANQNGNANGSISMNATASLVSAGGTITLDAAKDIATGLANAGAGIVSIFARTGAVTDANAASNNVTGTSLTATAATGIDLDTTITTLTSANVTGTGAIDINDLAGGLAVTSATTADGQITINATGGNLDATIVTAAGTSRNVTLSTTTSGNVNVGNVTATGDNIAITSVGNIEELGADAGADLTSGTMNLTAATGIGNSAQIEIDATTLTNASVSGTGAINLTDLAGGLAVTSATTADGAITINATSGNLDATTVTAAGTGRNVTLTTTTSGNINLGNVTASGDTVNVTSVGAIRGVTDNGTADVTAGTINLIAAAGGISGAAGVGALDVTATTALNADTATGDDSNITIDSIGNLPIGLVNAGAGVVTLVSTANMTDANDVTADNPAVTNIIGSTINLVAMVGGIGTVGNAVDFLASTQFNADTVTGDDSDINVRSTGNAPIGLIDAGTGDVKLTSQGNITDANDGGTPDAPGILNINGGQIDLITINAGDDIGQIANYFEIQPSTLWNVTTNSGDAYIACLGACPVGKVDLGSGFFYYAGNLTDGNDVVNGEHVLGGDWNIRAGGAHLDGNNTVGGFIGASSNWIEMRLAQDVNSDTVVDANGLLVGTAGTGGFHVSNDVPTNAALGLNIGFALQPATITGLTSTGGIEIYSFSPLVVAANVTDNSANSIDLVAAGNAGVDDLTVQTGVTVQQQGSGNVNLFAGDDIQLQGTALVQSTTGVINAVAGEDRTGDLIGDGLETDGTAAASIIMNSNSAFRSQDATINLTANNHLRISEVNANSNNDGTLGNVNLNADFNANGVGRIEDRNGAIALNVTGDALTMRAGSGIGVDAANVIDAIETSVNTVDLINSTTGHVAVTEVAAGGNLDILRANQNAPVDTITIKTLNGDLKVVGAGNGGFGVTTQAGELLLEANGAGANDDLIVNNTVTSTTGKINLDSTSRDVLFNANGDVTATTGAEIEVNAFRDIFMADGTVLNANAGGAQGGIDLDAGRDITLGSVQTTSALSVQRNTDAFDAVQIDAATGAVIDGGDLDDDIIAQNGQTTINAVTGIGSANQLDTQMHSLKATNATSGDIRIREVIAGGNLDLIGVTQSAATGALNIRTLDGSLTVLAVGLGGLGVSAIDGVTRLFARDNNNSGSDHLVINHTVRSADGKINLDSENDVIASAAGDVTAGDATLKVGALGAEIEVDAIDNITMADGTIFNANAGGPQGGIDMDAQNGNVTLGSVQTSNASNNAVTIHTEGGAIIDGGDIDRDIVNTGGGGVILSAQTGIGSRGTGLNLVPNSVLDNFAPDAIDMTGAGTRLSAFTEFGDIQIQNIGALEITTLADNDGGTPLGSAGAGTVTGVQINNPAFPLDANSIIFITAGSPITVNSVIRNFDGGNVSVYALGGTPADTMTINADIQSINGNGDVRVVSGSSMTMAPNVSISTQGNGVVAGTGRVAVGAGYNVTGKAADEAFAPGVSLLDPSSSLFDTVGDAGANLTMDEISRIWTEDGDILVDVQNVFTVGRVDADGNNDANGATASGLTDGNRGDITTFSRNGSTLDAEVANLGNLDFLANVLTMFSGDNIGLSNNPIEIDAPIFNAFSINNIFVAALGNVLANMFSENGSIFFSATGDILLGTAHAGNGGVSLTAGGSILSQGGSNTRVIARTPIQLTAGGVIGTLANAINTQLNGAGVLLINAGSAINGISSNVTGNFTPLGIQVLNAPGLVLFNGLAVGGDSLSTLKTSIASLFQGVLPQILGQFGRFNGNVSPDFPGLAKLSEFGHLAEAPMDTTGVDAIGLPGVPATTAEQRRPAAQPQQIPAPAVPQQQQPTPAPAVQTTTITPADATTPPTVVPIPDDAAPTEQELNVENQNRN